MSTVPGTYKLSLEGYRTFVPCPLPPQFSLTAEVYRQVEEAIYLLGQVEASRTLLPNADLLIYSSLQREALASSTIEGTIASPDELVLFQVSRSSEREAVREVANYGDALAWGVQEISTRPITTNLILGLHGKLMDRVRGSHTAGRFRDRQNHIGTRSRQGIEEAIFIPPAPQDVRELIAELEIYINSQNEEFKLVQCAIAHYQFETIHPFGDGNGRVGRLLIVLQMIQLGLLSAPLIYPSVYFERTRDDYYRLLQDVRESGAWNDWIGYFVQGVKEQCKETIDFTQTILKLKTRLHREIQNVRRRHSLNTVLDVFFASPILTPKNISESGNLSLGAVRSALSDLEELEIVYEVTGKKKGRVYACTPLLDVIFDR
jgi:Fic family protein